MVQLLLADLHDDLASKVSRFRQQTVYLPLPAAEPRLGRRTALTFPLLPPPQKN